MLRRPPARRHSSRGTDGAGEADGRHRAAAGRPQRRSAGVERGAGRVDVVHQHGAGTGGQVGTRHDPAPRVRAAGGPLQADLPAARPACVPAPRRTGSPVRRRRASASSRGLVVAVAPDPVRVRRCGDEHALEHSRRRAPAIWPRPCRRRRTSARDPSAPARPRGPDRCTRTAPTRARMRVRGRDTPSRHRPGRAAAPRSGDSTTRSAACPPRMAGRPAHPRAPARGTRRTAAGRPATGASGREIRPCATIMHRRA